MKFAALGASFTFVFTPFSLPQLRFSRSLHTLSIKYCETLTCTALLVLPRLTLTEGRLDVL